MLLSGEVATAPLAMAAALGVAFLGSVSIGAFVVSKTIRQGAGGDAESEHAAVSSGDEEAA